MDAQRFDLLFYDARGNADDHRRKVAWRTQCIEDHYRQRDYSVRELMAAILPKDLKHALKEVFNADFA